MIDSIGLGEALANLIYWAVLIIAVAGGIVFLIFKKKLLALTWLSIFLNFLSFLYFLGTIHYVILNFSVFIWPILNIFLIIYYFKTKARK